MTDLSTISDKAWEGALTCSCGRPYILLKVDEAHVSKNKELQPLAAYVRCPVHRRARRVLLPYSRLSEWVSAVADRLFRCNTCGEPAIPKKVATKGHWTAVLLECPIHGTQENKRTLWSPVYTAAKAVHEIQLTEVPSISDLFDEEESGLPVVCTRCGTENDYDARFCAYCGAMLEND